MIFFSFFSNFYFLENSNLMAGSCFKKLLRLVVCKTSFYLSSNLLMSLRICTQPWYDDRPLSDMILIALIWNFLVCLSKLITKLLLCKNEVLLVSEHEAVTGVRGPSLRMNYDIFVCPTQDLKFGGAKEKKKSHDTYPISAFCCLWQSVTPLIRKGFLWYWGLKNSPIANSSPDFS